MDTLLREILTSRVYDVARETPLDPAPRLSRRLGNDVLLKREDLQPVFSFKLRGAYNRIAHLTAAERARGVIAASAGNHAQGVAFSAQRLGHPRRHRHAADDARDQGRGGAALGAEVVLVGDTTPKRSGTASSCAAETGMAFIHPFDDPLVIAGQGTVGVEILRQSPSADRGVRAGRRRRADRRHRRLHQGGAARRAGHRRRAGRGRRDGAVAGGRATACALDHVGLFADGVAVRRSGEHTFPIVQATVRRDHPRHQRRDLRGDQGRLRRHAHDRGAGRRAGGRRAEVVRRDATARAGSGSSRC